LQTEKSLLHLVRRLGQIGEKRLSDELVGGTTPRQFMVLRSLSEAPGSSQIAIVQETGIDRSTMADIIKRLLKHGMVKRRRSESDPRAYIVDLTAEGRRIEDSAGPALARAEAKLLDAITVAQRAAFLTALERMVLDPAK